MASRFVLVVLKRPGRQSQLSYRRYFVGLTIHEAINRLNGVGNGCLPHFRMTHEPYTLNGHYVTDWTVKLKAGDRITAYTRE